MPELHPAESSAPRLDPAALARWRRRLEAAAGSSWLHQEVGRRMAERLPLVRRTPARVLDWSLDAGAPQPELLAAYPQSRVVQVRNGPVAPAPWWNRLRPGRAVAAQAEEALPAGEAGLVWSNMALHAEPDLPGRLAAWRRALEAEGFVMFSTLGPDSLRQLRSLYDAAGWGVAHVPFIDMHDLGDLMVHAGFADPVMDQELLTLTYTDPGRLLEDLRAWGMNLSPARQAGLRTPRWRERLLAGLQGRADAQGRIALTLELVYGHAFQAPERGPAVGGETTVDLATMRRLLRQPGPSR